MTGRLWAFEANEGRMYSGDPRPQSEVALIIEPGGSLASLVAEGVPEKHFMKVRVEVLPGKYTVGLNELNTGVAAAGSTVSTTYYRTSYSLTVEAKAGHVYILNKIVKFRGPNTYEVIDLAGDAGQIDYTVLKKSGLRSGFFQKEVENYFKGNRHELKEEFKKDGSGTGFWF
jgi:hypothetical protein